MLGPHTLIQSLNIWAAMAEVGGCGRMFLPCISYSCLFAAGIIEM